ncbi:MAG: hypothetical protein R3E13_01980 [Alphaproteobacteria bacterium]
MSGEFSIITREHDETAFLVGIGNIEAVANADQIRLEAQYRAFLHDDFKDMSFVVFQDGAARACVIAYKLDDVCGFGASGVEVYAPVHEKKLIQAILEHLLQACASESIKTLRVSDHWSQGALGAVGVEAYNLGALPSVKIRPVVELSRSEAELRRQVRKSYKSLINQGKREMGMVYVCQDNPDEKLFHDFREFHFQVAGRRTRSEESWQMQFEMIKAGCGDLVLGYMEEHGLVSSALFTDFGDVSHYAVAVYNRELFVDKPLGHAVTFEGILRAKERGMRLVNMGVIEQKGHVSDKEYNIGLFKKGFSNTLGNHIEWMFSIA